MTRATRYRPTVPASHVTTSAPVAEPGVSESGSSWSMPSALVKGHGATGGRKDAALRSRRAPSCEGAPVSSGQRRMKRKVGLWNSSGCYRERRPETPSERKEARTLEAGMTVRAKEKEKRSDLFTERTSLGGRNSSSQKIHRGEMRGTHRGIGSAGRCGRAAPVPAVVFPHAIGVAAGLGFHLHGSVGSSYRVS